LDIPLSIARSLFLSETKLAPTAPYVAIAIEL